MWQIFFILQANELHHVRIRREGLVYADAPRLGIRLSIIDGDVNFEPAKTRTPKPLGDFGGLRQRSAADIQPGAVPKADGLDDQRVPLPLSGRVPVESGLRIDRKGTPV